MEVKQNIMGLMVDKMGTHVSANLGKEESKIKSFIKPPKKIDAKESYSQLQLVKPKYYDKEAKGEVYEYMED